MSREGALVLLHIVVEGQNVLRGTEKGVITLTSEDVDTVRMATRMETMLLAHGWLVAWTAQGEPKLIKRVRPDQSVGALNDSLTIVEPLLNRRGIRTVEDLVNSFTTDALADIVGDDKAKVLKDALREHCYLMA